MRTDEQLARAQLEETERANAQMLEEIKRLNARVRTLEMALVKISTHYEPGRLIHSQQLIIEIARAALKGEANG